MVAIAYTAGHTTYDGYPALYADVRDVLAGQPLTAIEIVWIDGQQTYRDIEMRPIVAASLNDAIVATSTAINRV